MFLRSDMRAYEKLNGYEVPPEIYWEQLSLKMIKIVKKGNFVGNPFSFSNCMIFFIFLVLSMK